MQENAKILVIGGSGFIGERVVGALRAQGADVSAPPHSKLDLRDIAALRFHLSLHDMLIVLTQPDAQGINALVAALALSAPKHILYASTALLYGSSNEPQQEDAPLHPETPYEQAKFDEEETLRAAKGGHTLTIARLSNVYGGVKNKGLVGKALRAMYGGEPLVVAGEGQVRDFIHVADVAEALAYLVRFPRAGVVNVTTGKGVTIDGVLTELERQSGKNISWVRGVVGKRKNVIGDNRKLKQAGFVPKTSLTDGLRQTYQDYARSIQ